MSYFRWLAGLQTSKLARRRDMLMEVVNNFREHRQQKTLALAARAETYERIWSRLGFHSRTAPKSADMSPSADVRLPYPVNRPNQHVWDSVTHGEPPNSSKTILDKLPLHWREIYMQQMRDSICSNEQRLNRVRHINKVATGANTVSNLPALIPKTPLMSAAHKCFPPN